MAEDVANEDRFADSTATSIALGQPGKLDPRAAAFLEKQGHLVDLQAEVLAREEVLRHWSLRVHHVSDVLKLAFEFAVAVIVLAVAAFIGTTVWSAAHDDGLVIEAFSTPPDLAARGLTGEVVAGRMLDKLSALQAETSSLRAPTSYENNWGKDIKVEIPETGVSIGEFNLYLHQWLGHQTHITGDVIHGGSGIIVTARAGSDSGQSFSGPESNLDALLQQAAEAVYKRTQPYRYAVFLFEHGKLKEAITVFSEIARTGSPIEQAWANVGWSNALGLDNRVAESAQKARIAVTLNPQFSLGWFKVMQISATIGHEEAALAAGKTLLQVTSGNAEHEILPDDLAQLRVETNQGVDELLGDYRDELAQGVALRAMPNVLGVVLEGLPYSEAVVLAEDHDIQGARQMLASVPSVTSLKFSGAGGAIASDYMSQNTDIAKFAAAAEQKDWTRMVRLGLALDAREARLDAESNANEYLPTQIWPYIALAQAMTGDFAGAQAELAKTPLDCAICLRMRGNIRAAEKNWSTAQYWFAEAIRQAPSTPFGYADWGTMLLQEGKYDDAITKFKEANQKSPHFADPLELWGEALMQENRSDLALAKFVEADKYAPHWGRLHLKWGEALWWSGNKPAAMQQFATASRLDLSAADKQALAHASSWH
jgi:Tfp pilus assembly protein PilF